MAKQKAGELKKQAEALLEQGVTTKEAYRAALPLMFAVKEAAADASAFSKLLNALSKELSERAAAYAIDHATALDKPLSDYRDGIERGVVEPRDGVCGYSLTISPGEFRRITGGNLTQEFLGGLPAEWTKKKLELHLAALHGKSASELAEFDMYRVRSRTWAQLAG